MYVYCIYVSRYVCAYEQQQQQQQQEKCRATRRQIMPFHSVVSWPKRSGTRPDLEIPCEDVVGLCAKCVLSHTLDWHRVMIGLANPPSAVRYHCWELRDDGRRCKRCGNRSQLFGDRDVESGWEGYCGVCNMELYTWRLDSSVRTCNRACFIHCLCGLIRLPQACCLIRDFIFQGYAAKLRWSILTKFRFKVLQVSWLACPMEGWLESDSDFAADWVVRPSLRTLRYVFVESPGFKLQCKAAFPYFSLLDAVTTYLYHPMPCPPRCLPEDCSRYAQGSRDMSWRRCLHPDGWHWL